MLDPIIERANIDDVPEADWSDLTSPAGIAQGAAAVESSVLAVRLRDIRRIWTDLQDEDVHFARKLAAEIEAQGSSVLPAGLAQAIEKALAGFKPRDPNAPAPGSLTEGFLRPLNLMEQAQARARLSECIPELVQEVVPPDFASQVYAAQADMVTSPAQREGLRDYYRKVEGIAVHIAEIMSQMDETYKLAAEPSLTSRVQHGGVNPNHPSSQLVVNGGVGLCIHGELHPSGQASGSFCGVGLLTPLGLLPVWSGSNPAGLAQVALDFGLAPLEPQRKVLKTSLLSQVHQFARLTRDLDGQDLPLVEFQPQAKELPFHLAVAVWRLVRPDERGWLPFHDPPSA